MLIRLQITNKSYLSLLRLQTITNLTKLQLIKELGKILNLISQL